MIEEPDVMKLSCDACLKTFDFLPNEQKFYHRNNLSIPLTCKYCKKRNKISTKNKIILENIRDCCFDDKIVEIPCPSEEFPSFESTLNYVSRGVFF